LLDFSLLLERTSIFKQKSYKLSLYKAQAKVAEYLEASM